MNIGMIREVSDKAVKVNSMRGASGEVDRMFNTGRWVTVDEGTILLSLVNIFKPDNCFESGTANGYSTLWLANNLKEGAKVYTFDPVDRPKVWDEEEFNISSNVRNRIEFVNENFELGIRDYIKDCEGTKLVFIDGDHSGGGVYTDWKAIEAYLSKGDIIVFHDTLKRTVSRFFIRLMEDLNQPKYLEFVTRRGISAMFYEVENENRSQVKDFNLINVNTEKARDIADWRMHDKPYLEYPEKPLLSSSEKHLLYLTGKRLGAGNYANLGTWTGVSAACLAYGIRDSGQKGTIFGVDIFSIDKVRKMPEIIPQHFRNLGLDEHVDLRICKGLTSYWARELRGESFKFIFVDADHSYEGCKEDFEMWSPMLEVGGEIAFHDCEYEEIDRFLKEYLVGPKWEMVADIWRTKVFRKTE